MRRLAQIYGVFFRSSFVRELEFRANFFAKVIENIIWTVFFALLVTVIYANKPEIVGWNRGEAFVLASTVFLLMALTDAFFSSLKEIPEHVRRGTLDFIMTRPIDSQFWVSVRRFNFNQVGATLAGIIMLIYGVLNGGLSPALIDWLAYLLCTVNGLFIYYGIEMTMMTLGIYFVRVDNLWVLGDTMMTVARYPVNIYSLAAQRFLLYVFPLAVIGTIPARQLIHGATISDLALSCAWAVGLLLFSRWFWFHALRSYTSASS
ncbi:MAG: ABC-2 family transporter protein [Fimbriimonadaceae bacterium]|nr:ABC-2 family transporter protein [Fimbriimonadaceae bacterium]